MPLLEVAIATGDRTITNAHIAEILTDLTNRHLKKDPTRTAVAIRRHAPEDWFIGSEPLKPDQTSFSLRIAVTAGTNTEKEMADYINAVFAAMMRLFGSVHHVSYVIVDAVAGTHWGFGGKTQAHRAAVMA